MIRVQILRLFNLCDIGPVTQHTADEGRQRSGVRGSPDPRQGSPVYELTTSRPPTPSPREPEDLGVPAQPRMPTPESQESGELPEPVAEVVTVGKAEGAGNGHMLLPPPQLQRSSRDEQQSHQQGIGHGSSRSQHRSRNQYHRHNLSRCAGCHWVCF